MYTFLIQTYALLENAYVSNTNISIARTVSHYKPKYCWKISIFPIQPEVLLENARFSNTNQGIADKKHFSNINLSVIENEYFQIQI